MFRGGIERSTEAFILGIIKRDHRIGIAIASVPRIKLNLHDQEAMAHVVNEVQGQVAEALEMKGVILRQVSPGLIRDLVNAVDRTDGVTEAGRYMMLRHGGQLLGRETGDLKGASQKIRLMQSPHNMRDPLTDQSIAEAVGLSLALTCISQETNLPIRVRSSVNTRAAEVAAVVTRLTGGTVAVDNRLKCIDYPKDKTDEEIDNLLGAANKGSLRWDRRTVDGVIGPGTYDRITQDVAALIHEGVTRNGLTIDVTHTQQTNAADIKVGREPSRLAEMGFSIWRLPMQSTLFGNGIFLS